jgi:predicted MPP superfamily phosphohydrolase
MHKRAIVSFLGILIIALFLAHLVVYELLITAVPAIAIRSPWILFFVLAIFSTSFILTTMLVSRTENKFARLLYNIASYWTGVFGYLLIASAVCGVMILLWPQKETVLAFWFCLLGLAVGLWGIINAHIIREKVYAVSLAHLPSAWQNKKVAMISDVHLGAINGARFARRVVERLTAQNADLIFICGDFFDGVAADEETLAKIFSSLKPKDGIYIITGNHDGFVTSTREISAFKQAGLRVLENEMINVDGMHIIGVDYRSTAKRDDFASVLAKIPFNRNTPSILLKHVPTNLDVAENAGINLVLCGHTHNGQLAPANLLTKIIYKGFNYGSKMLGKTNVITSSGIGTWGPALRVGTHSEIVIVQFDGGQLT